MKQIILIKASSKHEYEEIKQAVEKGLDRTTVFAQYETSIEIVEIPDPSDERPTTIHNTYMGITPKELEEILQKVLQWTK